MATRQRHAAKLGCSPQVGVENDCVKVASKSAWRNIKLVCAHIFSVLAKLQQNAML
jgi:hypothetical protein